MIRILRPKDKTYYLESRGIGTSGKDRECREPVMFCPPPGRLSCSTIPLLMRRALATLLLVLFCFGLGSPFLQAQPNAVPACCRRDGKHHCAMSPKGDGFRAIAPTCPYRSFRALIPPSAGLKVSSAVLSIGTRGQFRILGTPTLIALQALGTAQERGPPVSYS